MAVEILLLKVYCFTSTQQYILIVFYKPVFSQKLKVIICIFTEIVISMMNTNPKLTSVISPSVSRDSSVGIATGYRLDGPGIESRWRREFPHLSRLALGAHPPPVQWVPDLSRGKERPGRDAFPSPPSSAVVMKG